MEILIEEYRCGVPDFSLSVTIHFWTRVSEVSMIELSETTYKVVEGPCLCEGDDDWSLVDVLGQCAVYQLHGFCCVLCECLSYLRWTAFSAVLGD